MRILLALNLIIWFIYSSAMGTSAEIVANVVLLKGDASVIPLGSIKSRSLKQGDSIARGDSVETRDKTVLKLAMVDQSVLVFGPKTKFNLREFVYNEKKVRTASFDLVQGQMRAKFSKFDGENNKIEIHTKAVSLGVRGTEVMMNEILTKQGKRQTHASLLSGSAVVVNKQTKKLTELFPGAIFVADAGMPGQILKNLIPKDKLERLDRALKPPVFDPNSQDFALADAKTDDRTVEEMSDDYFLDPGLAVVKLKKKSLPAKK